MTTSVLNEIGNFSFERMDEMAREIVYLKHRVEILESRNKDYVLFARRDADRISKLEVSKQDLMEHIIPQFGQRLSDLEKACRLKHNEEENKRSRVE